MRKHYIDNLRWMVILLLIPYHAAMAWNTWGEPNYIIFEGNRLLSSLIVFFSPFIMPLLFILAGISTKYALIKRSYGEYVIERVKRLIVPLLSGVILIMPVMTFIADRYNCGYDGSFISHYGTFFTKFTDLTGADGGFSLGQFWFLLYLFVISLLALGLIAVQRKAVPRDNVVFPLWYVILLGLPLSFLHDLLSIGGKSLVEFTYLFIVGFYVLSSDAIIEKLRQRRRIFLIIGLVSSLVNIILFIWTDIDKLKSLNTFANFVAEWFMILALLGYGKSTFDMADEKTSYLSYISFPFFSLHYIWLVLFQYLTAKFSDNTAVLFIIPVIASFIMTFVSCFILLKIPPVRFLLGAKAKRK